MIQSAAIKSFIPWAIKISTARLGRRPFFVNLEVTKRCNARCAFCNNWTTKEESVLPDYTDVIRHIDPVTVNIAGGEPLLRSDLPQIITNLRKAFPLLRITLITNGWLLNEDLARQLEISGIDQLSISLDFPDNRHDGLRGINGLFAHIDALIPKLVQRRFLVTVNSVLFRDNLDSVTDLVGWSSAHGIKIGFSCYSSLKTGKKRYLVGQDSLAAVSSCIANLFSLKRTYGNITNSDYYLRKVYTYFREGRVAGCKAGRKWLQITPEGFIKRCSEKPVRCDWPRFSPRQTFLLTTCDLCWFACRGESEAPPQIERVKKYFTFLINNGR